ncbi:hypothetical protein D9756_000082 [Leucocoprinus leucothites]|uniref:F-box domain-containing protein n=1 Tax=Leucocoprinus leucothites TaxID=201217 RepID=A0A8H5GFK4_9AGAR|nr:hypothetical protein D9756_000082 [Leucoagaricus leucothites]
MKQISDSVGRLWNRVTRRRRTQDSQESQPEPQPQVQAQPAPTPAPAPAPTHSYAHGEPDRLLEIERQLLYHRIRQRLPPREPRPRPDPPPRPPLVIAPVSSLLSDIQGDLTVDVLTQIFIIYNNVSRDRHNDYSNQGIPWILGQICRSWRQVALNTPNIWNMFSLEIDEKTADGDLPEMHQTLLARSANASLRISFEFSRYNEPIPGRPFRILEPLLERSTQWSTVLLRGLSVPEIYRQFGPARDNLPALWSLKIYFRNKATRDSVVLPGERGLRNFDFFKNAPVLNRVLLNNMADRQDHYDIMLPWNQIKTFSSYNTPDNPFPDELDRQPNLESLTAIYNEFLPLTPRQIAHQNLRELYIYATHGIEDSFEQVTQLVVPSLELLVIIFMTMELRHKVSIIPTVISLIENSKCSLKSLAIEQNCDLHIDKLPTLFSLTPKLETLDIGHGKWFRAALTALRFDPEKETVLPNLQRLAIAYTVGTNPVDIKLIKELVESRKQVFTDPSRAGQLFHPLLYVRLHIKRSETRYWCLMDLEGRYVPPEGHTRTDAYCLELDVDPEWEPKVYKAMGELRLLIDSPTRASDSETAQLVAKYYEVEDLYRRRILCTIGQFLNPPDGEAKPVQALRALANQYVPDEYLRQRKWIMASDMNLFYLHPDHDSRTSSQKADIVIGVRFPPATGFEGYGYWFSADIDRQMENMRPFIC